MAKIETVKQVSFHAWEWRNLLFPQLQICKFKFHMHRYKAENFPKSRFPDPVENGNYKKFLCKINRQIELIYIVGLFKMISLIYFSRITISLSYCNDFGLLSLTSPLFSSSTAANRRSVTW